jgi:hypothetical protein
LRNFSKKKEEALLDKYKAKTLFGNIDQLLPVSEAFLSDLEKMIGPNGQKLVGGLGDVCLKHVRLQVILGNRFLTLDYSFAINEHSIATSYTMQNERKRRLSSKRKSQRVERLAFQRTSRFAVLPDPGYAY